MDPAQAKLKHLEFIQTTIARMAAHSFALKGWSVTLVSALFALAAKDADARFVLVAYFPAFMFWALDAFFLYQEWRFRDLYDAVSGDDRSVSSFSMKTKAGTRTWWGAVFSKTLLPFHGCIILVVLIVMFVILGFDPPPRS